MPYGYSENKEAIQRRLRRIEGQVRGLQRMVEEAVSYTHLDVYKRQGQATATSTAFRSALRWGPKPTPP